MKRKLTSVLLLSALLTAGTSTFISCKDYDSDAIGDIQGQVGDLSTVLSTQITKLNSTVTDLSNLTNRVTNAEGRIDATEDRIDATEGDIAVLQNTMSTVQLTANDALGKAQEALDKLDALPDDVLTKDNYAETLGEVYASKSGLDELANTITADGGIVDQLEALDADVTTIVAELDSVETELGKIGATASSALALAKADSVRIDVIDNLLNKADYTYSELVEDVIKIKGVNVVDSATLADSIQVIKDQIAAHLTAAKKFREIADSLVKAGDSIAIETAMNHADTLNASTLKRVDLMEQAYKAADEVLSARIDSLADELSILEGQFNVLNDRLARLITNINIDKVSNPMFGSLNLPLGLKSTVLCAFYGTTTNTGVFPTTNGSDYVYSSESGWTLVDGASSKSIIADAKTGLITDGFAGKIMMTINPANVDFKNLNVSLSSRGDGSAPAAYKNKFSLQASTENVTTRSASNGAFDAEVYAAVDNNLLEASKLNVNESEIISAAKQILNKIKNSSSTNINVLDIAQTVYSNFVSAIPQYYSVKAEWTEDDLTGETNEVNSDYEIAAITMKPLSFGSMASGTSYTLPDIPTISDLGFEITGLEYDPVDITTIKDITISIPDVNSITISEKEGSQFVQNVVVNVNVDTETGQGSGSGNVEINFDALSVSADSTEITVSLEQMRNIVAQINDQVGNMITNVNGQIDDILSNINSSYITRINSYIGRVNGWINRLEDFIQNPNKLLRPVMFYQSNGSYGRLSQVSDVPSVFRVSTGSTGSISLIPTTYTAELLAPAYKKWVQVKTVAGTGSATLSNGSTSGQGILLHGKEHGVVLTGTAGSTYEVVYSAVDYYGKVVARKYYIQIQ